MVPLAMIRLLEKERLLQRRFEECCVTVDKAVGKALAQRPLMPPVSWLGNSLCIPWTTLRAQGEEDPTKLLGGQAR